MDSFYFRRYVGTASSNDVHILGLVLGEDLPQGGPSESYSVLKSNKRMQTQTIPWCLSACEDVGPRLEWEMMDEGLFYFIVFYLFYF